MKKIDINCDMGEGFGLWPMGHDAALIQFISSANIACGFHAGDPVVMRDTVRLALKHHAAIGAHPGLPDLQGFGRRTMNVTPDEVYAMVLYQTGALMSIAKAEGGRLHHVKPHGALYNMAAKDMALANAIAKAVYHVDPELMLYGLSGSAMIEAAHAYGLKAASEVFMDRTYQEDGTLTPRSHTGAVITDVALAVKQALQMVEEQSVTTITGKSIPLTPDTICIHGDSSHAVLFASQLFDKFKSRGIEIRSHR